MTSMKNIYSYWAVVDRVPNNPDCFIVLSYCVKDAQTPANPNRIILDLTYRWWKKFPQAAIIVSTGDNQKLGVTNAHVMAEYLKKLGVPKHKIIEEGRSKTTYENLLYSRAIAYEKKRKNITLVTYDLHTRRTLAVARKLGWSGLSWISIGGYGGPSYGIKTLQTHSRLTIFLYELMAWVYNRIRGEL